MEQTALLAAYDQQLRTARTASVLGERRVDSLRLMTLGRGHLLVTYAPPRTGDDGLRRLVRPVLEVVEADPVIECVDWRTWSHDEALGLTCELLQHGFVLDAHETTVVGKATALAVDVAVPEQVRLRRVTTRHDVVAMERMQAEVFGDADWMRRVDLMMARAAVGDGMEMWVAEIGNDVVAAGRVEPVSGTDFADLCGGAVRPDWRGRGIYRALTAARARAALRAGKVLLHSSCTEDSRPILQRAGLTPVCSTARYRWRPTRPRNTNT